MDFLKNPVGSNSMEQFDIDKLEPEAREYLQKAGALQKTPIERLAHMNTPAIEIYKEKKTPCMIEGITSKKWDWDDIFMKFYPSS